ncbi:MAG: N-6 DNA methylase [Magnetococcales bacterium]|nr:N-6 DNA methylase [Magnetococcales bacterium]MBF0115936.1 N-6 DNA methylase [Magnetococcales bacterium]
MQALDRTLRGRLERTVKEARQLAESAARVALGYLGVAEPEAPGHLSDQERALRRQLRAHARQLGDAVAAQESARLSEEVAYEHWHRMLFARFLAENELLMMPDPQHPVAVSLAECEDLAADEGLRNGWEVAARFASRMLPHIFRPDAPVFLLALPPEYQQKLEKLLAELPQEIFIAADALGWVYQFWQAQRKEAVNASEIKIGARELPAVTQLFTEAYMVSFLLDNSLGAWWAGKRLTAEDWASAADEESLRRKAALPGVPLDDLRFVRAADGRWQPAAGTFAHWPNTLQALKILDPCCGSGHFLVAVFLLLVPLRMALENLTARQAVEAVLRENLHGLEIDARCVELAAFALALAAWRYPEAGGYRALPELQLACSGLSVGAAKEEWVALANGNKNLRIALDWLHEEFQHAPTLGSLLDPAKSSTVHLTNWENLSSAMTQALAKERSDEEREAGITAQGLARAAQLLGGKYHWVVTNVPYLQRGKQDETLRRFCEHHHAAAKNDLATVFLDRCLTFCRTRGTVSVVLPQNWLFLTTYRKFREKLLKNDQWRLLARLGPGAFETISGEVVKAVLLVLDQGTTYEDVLMTTATANIFSGLDVSQSRTVIEKAEGLRVAEIVRMDQGEQLANPDARLILDVGHDILLLNHYSDSYWGLGSGDYPRFGRFFWELVHLGKDWIFQLSTMLQTGFYGAREHILYWQEGKGEIAHSPGAFVRGTHVWGKQGLHVSQMSTLPITIYTGECWDSNSAPIIPRRLEDLPAIWCFCASPDYNAAVRKIDQKLNVTNATLVKVPFDLAHWSQVAQEQYPHGLPKPYTDDPTQWIFHGHPCGSVLWNEESKRLEIAAQRRVDGTVLQVAVARLLGYRWPAELDAEMALADEQRHWLQQCTPLLAHADAEGIVCLPAVREQPPAAERVLKLLAATYGDDWSHARLNDLLAEVGCAGKTLEFWLREQFFLQHCKLFHHRPFIWHIWDGLRDGFAALVNNHRLDRKKLEMLTYSHLGDWLDRQREAVSQKVEGAEERLAAALTLQKRLEAILAGEAPLDIFVRWKPLEQQPIGWEPDLNDGVRLNIRPFMTAQVLRFNKKPQLNIAWEKDRGKDVPSAPWYHRFQGDRINDHHLTLAEKQAAREMKDKHP